MIDPLLCDIALTWGLVYLTLAAAGTAAWCLAECLEVHLD